MDHNHRLSAKEWASGSWLPQSEMPKQAQRDPETPGIVTESAPASPMPTTPESPHEVVLVLAPAPQSKAGGSSADTTQTSPQWSSSATEEIRKLRAQLTAQAEQFDQERTTLERRNQELQSRCPTPCMRELLMNADECCRTPFQVAGRRDCKPDGG